MWGVYAVIHIERDYGTMLAYNTENSGAISNKLHTYPSTMLFLPLHNASLPPFLPSHPHVTAENASQQVYCHYANQTLSNSDCTLASKRLVSACLIRNWLPTLLRVLLFILIPSGWIQLPTLPLHLHLYCHQMPPHQDASHLNPHLLHSITAPGTTRMALAAIQWQSPHQHCTNINQNFGTATAERYVSHAGQTTTMIITTAHKSSFHY